MKHRNEPFSARIAHAYSGEAAQHITVVQHGDLTELIEALKAGYEIHGVVINSAGHLVYTMVRFP